MFLSGLQRDTNRPLRIGPGPMPGVSWVYASSRTSRWSGDPAEAGDLRYSQGAGAAPQPSLYGVHAGLSAQRRARWGGALVGVPARPDPGLPLRPAGPR